MKKLTFFLLLFVVGIWLFGSLDYPKTYNWEHPALLSKFFTSPQLNDHRLKLPKEKRLNISRFSTAQLTPLWLRIYIGENADQATSIQQTDDGGYIVIGITRTFTQGLHNIFLLKLSPSGGIEWQQSYAAGDSQVPNGFQETSDGGYIITGSASPYVNHPRGAEVFVLKLSSNGDIEWQGAYGGNYGESGTSIRQTSDGGYIVAGLTTTFAGHNPEYGFDWNVWLLKLSPSGDIEWQRGYGGNYEEGDWLWWRQQPTVQQTSDGGYILATDTESFGAGDADIWVLKLFSNGDIEWQKTYGGESWETLGRGTTIHETEDGGYIIAGNTWSFGAGLSDVWVLKLSLSGDIEWQRTYGGESGSEIPHCIQLTNDGGYIIVGGTTSFGVGNVDFFLLKLSSSGDIEWQRTVGKEGFSEARDVQQTSDEGYIVAGPTSLGTGAWSDNFDLYIVKVSSNGEIGAGAEFAGSSNFTVADTYVLPSETSVTPEDTDGSTSDINFVPEFCGFSSELLSWNLNQPPMNVSLRREVNRALFAGEAFNTISWEQDSYNSQFVIAEYRIYRKDAEDEEDYQLIDSVPGNTLEYVDGYLDIADDFVYVVTSVDSDSNESPRSESVSTSDSANNIENSNTVVSDTRTSSSDTKITRKDTKVYSQPKAISKDILVRSKQFSQDRDQNLVQPPLNVLLTRGEDSQTIRWRQNPYNSQSVAEYRIYRKRTGEDDESYMLIGSVPGTENKFIDYTPDPDKNFIYEVRAVDSNYNESSNSKPVKETKFTN